MEQQQSKHFEYIPQVNTSGDTDDQALSNHEIQRETDKV